MSDENNLESIYSEVTADTTPIDTSELRQGIESPELIDALADKSDLQNANAETVKNQTPYAMQHIDKFEQLEGERLKKIFDKDGKEHEETTVEDLSDFFNMQFSMTPETMSSSETMECDRPEKLQLVERMLESPEFQSSRDYTMLDVIASDIACEQTSKQYSILIAKNKKNPKNAKSNMASAAFNAIKNVSKEVEEYKDTMNAIGAGKEVGNNPGLDAKKIKEMYMKVRKNNTLKRIFNLAGRFRMMARSLQRMKVSFGIDELVGTELGSDIPKLLPIELGSLVSDNLGLRAITMSELVENNLLQFEHHGYEPAAKGPIVVCVDESGSMQGNRIESAKAFCLAMGLIAQMQKRWIAFVSFSDSYSGRSGDSKVCFPPDQWNQEELLQWLVHFYNGGTEHYVPLEKLPFKYWPEWEQKGLQKGKTDIIYLTDGDISVPADAADKFNKWKLENEVKVHTLIIESECHGFDSVSDFLYNINAVDINDKSIQQMMSI